MEGDQSTITKPPVLGLGKELSRCDSELQKEQIFSRFIEVGGGQIHDNCNFCNSGMTLFVGCLPYSTDLNLLTELKLEVHQ